MWMSLLIQTDRNNWQHHRQSGFHRPNGYRSQSGNRPSHSSPRSTRGLDCHRFRLPVAVSTLALLLERTAEPLRAMIIFPFVSDRFGRRTSMLCYWLIIAAGVAAESGARNWKIWVGAYLSPIHAAADRFRPLPRCFQALG